MSEFLPEELLRYHQQMRLPGLGMEGQKKLSNASVLIAGATSLGIACLQHLTAAGVGRVCIYDPVLICSADCGKSNLFDKSDQGKPKARIAVQKLQKINPHIELQSIDKNLSKQSILKVIEQFSLIALSTNSLPMRYVLNDAGWIKKIPVLYTALEQQLVQISLFNVGNEKGENINYRDAFDYSHQQQSLRSNESGSTEAVAGIAAGIQAYEIIKFICYNKTTLAGKLLHFDAFRYAFQSVTLKAVKENPLRVNPHQFPCESYELQYGEQRLSRASKLISPERLKKWLQEVNPPALVDVRDAAAHQLVNIGGKNIPLSQIENLYPEMLGKHRVVIYCHDGTLSAKAVNLLENRLGIENLYLLKGGLFKWAVNYEPALLAKLHQ